MKLSEFFSKRTLLDEMQEQTEQKIMGRGFWFLWIGLMVVLAVQCLAGASAKQMAAEFILFMASCVYISIEELRHGIWDPHFKPNNKTCLILALAAGTATAVFNGLQGIVVFEVEWQVALLAAVISFVLTSLLTFLAGWLTIRLYKKRRKTLDTEETDEEGAEHADE